MLAYLRDMQPSAADQLKRLHSYAVGEFMTLDESTRRNLELTETIRGGDVRGSSAGYARSHAHAYGRAIAAALAEPAVVRRAVDWAASRCGPDLSLMIRRDDWNCAKICAPPVIWSGGPIVWHRGWRSHEILWVSVKYCVKCRRSRTYAIDRAGRGAAAISGADTDEASHGDVSPGEKLGNARLLPELPPCAEVLSLLEAGIADEPPATTGNARRNWP